MKGIARRILFSVFPRPRRAVSWWNVLTPTAFLIVFGGGCAILEWRRVVLFSNPKAFGLMAVTPWVWWLSVAGFSGLGRARSLVSLITRLILVAVLVAALAEPRAVRKNHTLSLVYALDVSDSMGAKVSDQALSYILKTASAKPEKDEAGLVVFGREAAVELPPRMSFPFETINSRVGHDATDLSKALSLAAAVIPQDNQGRIVLVSDGVQTEGDVERVMEELRTRGIRVDVLPIQYAYPNEVWLERLELPRTVKIGETYEVGVLLSSLARGSGKLVLRENGNVIAEQEVAFDAGKNRYTLPLYLREPGYYEYVATIEPAAGLDGWAENNSAINYLYLKGEGKVLVVTDPGGDPRDWEDLTKALKAARRVVEVRSAYEFPRDALTLLPFDSVIFVNAPADSFDAQQLQAVRDAVFHQGIGFLMVGGKNGFGPGGWHRTAVEEALPVTMDISQKKVLPKGALVIVLHTCEFAEGNVWAKRIAKEAIRVLGAQDEVGLLIYDGKDRWVFPLTPAGEYEKLVALINQCEPMDMPSFASIMQLGLKALEDSDAAMKHMIIISDGDPSPPPPSLVDMFVAGKISVSTVVINPHGGQDPSILQTLAGVTGGRYYRPDDPQQLPSIFIKEAKTLKRSMIQNKTFVPAVQFPSAILKGIEALPELRGYVLTTPKPRATTILKGPDTEDVDPVLATWRFGLGTTAAFTSDLSENWGAAWVRWPRYEPFVKQLITEISRVEQHSDLHLQAFVTGSEGVIQVEDYDPHESLLEMEAQVMGPHQRSETVRLEQVGPRRYQARLPLWGKGQYQVVAAGTGGGRSEQVVGGFVMAYSPEYLRFRSDPILLKKIASRTGGRVLTGNETGKELFGPQRVPRESSKSIVDWLLLALACLVPLDVGVRRVQLDWSVIRGWFGAGRKGESTETLSALLKRKERARQPTAPRGERPPTLPIETGNRPPPTAPKPTQAASTETLSTTEQLLARKRKRQEDSRSKGEPQ